MRAWAQTATNVTTTTVLWVQVNRSSVFQEEERYLIGRLFDVIGSGLRSTVVAIGRVGL